MSNEQAAPETKGVTAELLATVDLGREIEGMAGRQLQPERVVCIEAFRPGAVARMVERGDYLRRDDPVVERFPEFFAQPLTRTAHVANGSATD
jgi:hypothetical protein